MKNISTRLLFALILVIIMARTGHAQDSYAGTSEKDRVQFNIFEFEGTDRYRLVFPVPDHLDTFSISIKAYISAGDLSIEIYDPSGERSGNFRVQGQSDLSKSFQYNYIMRAHSMSTTRGHIEKDPGFFTFNEETFKHYRMGNKVAQASISRFFRAPLTGEWIIKAECTKAKGFFTIENNEWLLKSNMPTEFVNGTVVDTKNRPISGATIRTKDVYGGTTSDDKGEFSVPLRDRRERYGQPEIIIVQYKKMKKEVIIGDQPKITVVLGDQK
jgi:hypothetical protein